MVIYNIKASVHRHEDDTISKRITNLLKDRKPLIQGIYKKIYKGKDDKAKNYFRRI